MKLKGRVAVITGASRGIGRQCALHLAKHGASLVLASKSLEGHPKLPGSLRQVQAELEALGARVHVVQTDVREMDQVEHLRDETRRVFGRADILINNAGALWWKPVMETPLKRFDLVMAVNARGAFACAQAFVPMMVEQRWGHIINMSPPLDLRHVPGHVAYLTSKFGMTLLTYGLAEEIKEHNVAVHSLWPATAVESEAVKVWGVGDETMWRKADILADGVVALVTREPGARTGKAWIDEDLLREEGVTDFEKYNVVAGGNPLRLEFGSSV